MQKEKKKKKKIINYDTLELQDYLKSCAKNNQKQIFHFRCEIFFSRWNFQRSINMNQKYCTRQCQEELNFTHMTLCHIVREKNMFIFKQLSNWTLEENLTLKQIKIYEPRRRGEIKTLLSSTYIWWSTKCSC